MTEVNKPAWLRRVHVAAHMGHPAQGCPLCARIMADNWDILGDVQAVAARMREQDTERQHEQYGCAWTTVETARLDQAVVDACQSVARQLGEMNATRDQ